MITYLKDGWYTRLGQRRLRNEVVDGAIDTASMLFRAAVPPEAISTLALKIRALVTIADPPHRRGMGGFGAAERQALTGRLQQYTDRFPVLQGFINDCMEHVSDAQELRALYLHLVHVTQMMQLLMVAKLSGAAGGLFFGASGPGITSRPAPANGNGHGAPSEANAVLAKARPAAARPAKKKATKKVAKKKPTKKKAAAKQATTRKKAPARKKATVRGAVRKKPVAKRKPSRAKAKARR
ncbi:MAG TPA: hypothetical protein VFH51_01210 [Myxococcota bacterium]|nr:hypothetical protein [Myxococcota bacterium]